MKIYTEINKLGKMPDRVEKRIQEWKVKNAGKRIEIELKRQIRVRSISQNSFLHGGILPQIVPILKLWAKERGDENYYEIDEEAAKDWIKKKFLGYETIVIAGEVIIRLKKTSQQDKYTFAEMIDNCVRFFALKGYELQMPEDYWAWLEEQRETKL